MNTLSKSTTAQFFHTPDDYDRLIAVWRCWTQGAETRHNLTAAHHLLYLILRGRNWQTAFTPITNAVKLENGAFYTWGARRAVYALHNSSLETELLAPFRDVITPEALPLIRLLVPLRWDENPLEREPYHAE